MRTTSQRVRLALVVSLALAAAAATAAAEPAPAELTAAAPARPHTLYVELMGKGGLWGVGYDLRLGRIAVGAAASFTVIDHEQILSFSPYLAVYPLGLGRHRFFTHAGPQLVHVSTASPVPEWPGTQATGLGGELAAGYEYRRRLVFRAYAMAAFGKGGVAPWAGFSLGWSL